MTMRTIHYLLAVFLLSMAWTPDGMAMGKKNPGDMVTVTGIIRVTGSMPLTHVVLVPEGEDPDRATRDRLYLVTGDLAKELMARDQGRTVTLRGPLCTPTSPDYVKCISPVDIRRPDR